MIWVMSVFLYLSYLCIYIEIVTGTTVKPNNLKWTLTASPTLYWTSISCSNDGLNVIATSTPTDIDGSPVLGGIYYSTDSALTWTSTAASTASSWSHISMSGDGMKAFATADQDGIYLYSKSSNTLSRVLNVVEDWQSIWCDASGTKVLALTSSSASPPNNIYRSDNSGATWSISSLFPGKNAYYVIASSNDGTKLLACIYSANDPSVKGLYVSSNSGTTWLKQTVYPAGLSMCYTASASDSGLNLIAIGNDWLFFSSSGGVTWNSIVGDYANNAFGTFAAISGDGSTYLVLGDAVDSNYTHISRDGGGSWEFTADATPLFTGAISYTGTRLFSLAQSKLSPRGIYALSLTTSSPSVSPSRVFSSASTSDKNTQDHSTLLIQVLTPTLVFLMLLGTCVWCYRHRLLSKSDASPVSAAAASGRPASDAYASDKSEGSVHSTRSKARSVLSESKSVMSERRSVRSAYLAAEEGRSVISAARSDRPQQATEEDGPASEGSDGDIPRAAFAVRGQAVRLEQMRDVEEGGSVVSDRNAAKSALSSRRSDSRGSFTSDKRVQFHSSTASDYLPVGYSGEVVTSDRSDGGPVDAFIASNRVPTPVPIQPRIPRSYTGDTYQRVYLEETGSAYSGRSSVERSRVYDDTTSVSSEQRPVSNRRGSREIEGSAHSSSNSRGSSPPQRRADSGIPRSQSRPNAELSEVLVSRGRTPSEDRSLAEQQLRILRQTYPAPMSKVADPYSRLQSDDNVSVYSSQERRRDESSSLDRIRPRRDSQLSVNDDTGSVYSTQSRSRDRIRGLEDNRSITSDQRLQRDSGTRARYQRVDDDATSVVSAASKNLARSVRSSTHSRPDRNLQSDQRRNSAPESISDLIPRRMYFDRRAPSYAGQRSYQDRLDDSDAGVVDNNNLDYSLQRDSREV